ncbi:DUF2089 family protein, partial [candidate division WOR-3 bacterium]|nr:DUF2089 family protein [candidate division WOR-3 bacterium]
ISIKGDLDFNHSLPDDVFNFIKIFLYSEGNIKKVEKILNCSYPKVKNLLREAKTALGVSQDEQDDESTDISGVLDLLKEGKITYEQAMEEIKKTK